MAQRKLQQEIDRVFKRVNEGLQAFDYLYEKLTSSENPSQKDKLESDLKKEIKKLQRQREQIKNWLSGNEVKDKKPLLEYRKKIEKQMERFKIVERDMKTKAFSKEGLNMERKLDPREKEKLECSDFISETIDKVNQQNETLEAQIQQIQSSVKKNKKLSASKQQQVDSLEECMEKNNWHLSKLEIILRYLENGQVEPEQINEIKDSINYYIESNQDPDFYDDDTIYDTLGLDEVEPAFGTVGEFVSANSDEEANFDEEDHETSLLEQPQNSRSNSNNNNNGVPTNPVSTAAAALVTPGASSTTEHANKTTDNKINELSESISKAAISSNKKQDVPRTSTPVEKVILVTSSNVASSNNTPTNSSNGNSHNSTPSVLNNLRPAPIPKVTEVKYSALLHNHLDGKKEKDSAQKINNNTPINSAGVINTNVTTTSPTKISNNSSFAASLIGSGVTSTTMAAALNGSVSNLPSRTVTPVLNSISSSDFNDSNMDARKEEWVMAYLPGLDDLIPSFEQHKNEFDDLLHHKVEMTPVMQNVELQQYISNSLINCPDAVDSEKPFSYYPSKPHPTSIDYPTFEYGIENNGDLKKDGVSAGSNNNNNNGMNNQHNFCLVNAMNSDELFKKLSTETLFYIFYYGDDNGSNPNYQATSISMEKSHKLVKEDNQMNSVFDFDNNDNGTYVQYCAFKELYSRKWKFHKTLFGWFKKLENTTKGVYQWFDTEVDWSVKSKELNGVDWEGDLWEVVV